MGIDEVVIDVRGIEHNDDRRTITTACNGDLPFNVVQVKFADVKDNTVVLGGHYHNYWEAFYLKQGVAGYVLVDVDDPKKRLIGIMEAGSRLIIPPKVAHKVKLSPNAVLVGMTEKEYVSAEENDTPYEIKADFIDD